MAHLLEKTDPIAINSYFDCAVEQAVSESNIKQLNQWFPQSSHHRLWTDSKSFHQIIRKGCWPLSPYAGWLLFHLAAAGQHLQQRSALSLLSEAFNQRRNFTITGFDWQIQAADIWSEDLEREFLIAEEGGNRGTIAHAYANVMANVGQHLAKDEEKLLRAVVLASKLGLVAQNRVDASEALAALSGLSIPTVGRYLKSLEGERNVLTWDDRFNQFEIISDTASRPQFLAFLRQKISDKYDIHGRAQLFLRRVGEFCPDVLCDRRPDFAEKYNISTMEWSFSSAIANLDELPRMIDEAIKNWQNAIAVDQSRGTIIYCYVEPENDLARIQTQTTTILKNFARQEGLKALPILIVFQYDSDGLVGQCLAELTVLDEDLSEQDKIRFGNLVGAHHQKSLDLLTTSLGDLIKQQNYALCGNIDFDSRRLDVVCGSIFEVVYPKILPFPFDGFSTPRGNAADSCHSLTMDLIRGNLTYNEVMAKPVRDKNRANEVLKRSWQVFLQNGDVGQKPNQETVRAVFSAWENNLRVQGGYISLADLLGIACRPPFGANIASAGLLLGVYLCARQKLFDLTVGDNRIELAELNGDMVFRGKFLDLNRLKNLVLLPKEAEMESEWDAFLDEWESAVDRSYEDQIKHLEKSAALRNRVSPPRSQAYRISLLEMKAKEAKSKLTAMETKVSTAYERIKVAAERLDLHGLTFSALKLKEVIGQMKADGLFPQKDVDRYQNDVDVICQRVVQHFDAWLAKQAPRGRTTKDASDFERFMRETSINLERLGLDEQSDNAERHAANAIRQINRLAEAQTLSDTIEGWLTEHGLSRALRVVDLRNDSDTAKENLKKVTEILKNLQVPSLESAKIKLNEFIRATKQQEKEFKTRLSRMYETQLTIGSIDKLTQEVDDLERIFERCDSDIGELRTMRRALQFYKNATDRLFDGNLSEETFTGLWNDLNDQSGEIADEEPPWLPDDTLPIIYEEALRKREALGSRWLSSMANEVEGIKQIDIAAASNLHSRLQQIPGYLMKPQLKRAKDLQDMVETHLNNLKVEWLLQRYRELDARLKAAFLKAIGI